MRILFLITGLNYGGAETQLKELAIRLKSRGHEILVVSMIPPQAYVGELKNVGISVKTLGMRQGLPDPRAIFRLATIIRNFRPLILHSHMVHANLLARMVRMISRIPVLICTAHNINEGGRLREMAYRLTDSLCDLTTQVSKAGLHRYVQVKAVPQNKVHFIPNGVDINRFRPDEKARKKLRHEFGITDEFVWLAVGRFEEAKDYPNMIQAFSRLVKVRPDARLFIAGQGALKTKIERLVVELGLDDAVSFLGIRKDVPELMNAADAYVMSSAWEGFPLVLLEAAAVGLPIVATDVGGNREIVLNDQSGFLVPPQDPVSLAEAMERVMALGIEARKLMGKAGRTYVVENFSFERVIKMWEELYHEILCRKGWLFD